jgi:hypothetical protein
MVLYLFNDFSQLHTDFSAEWQDKYYVCVI